ncbi:MAG: mutM [Acidimicrobiales bacterium]|nr:mutM [Acidimicrobiales bacterium]
MPELPEVETVRLGLVPLVTGRRIVDAGSHPSAKFASAPDAIGPTVTDVTRRGKYLLLELDDARHLVIHLGMTGQLRIRGPQHAGDPYVRAWWELDDGSVLELRDVRRFGRVAVVPVDDHRALPTLAGLGPDPFDEAFTPALLWSGLRASRLRVKTQLLQQRVVAGVGNIYADEALWLAQVNPAARTVTRAQAERLHAALREVLAAGIANGGTTLRDYRAVSGASGTNQHFLSCYGRAGEPCLRCGVELRRRVLDGRGTTWCPTCQR